MKECEIILEEIRTVLNTLKPEGIEKLLSLMQNGNTLFLAGEGRSGFMAKSFAMRLFHLGLQAYAVGETITPFIQENDVLIAVSGSGTSAGVIMTATKAREAKALVLAVTTDGTSSLAELADEVIIIDAATRFRKETEAKSVQPLGSLFDQCAHILFDAVCLQYATDGKMAHNEAFHRHTNL